MCDLSMRDVGVVEFPRQLSGFVREREVTVDVEALDVDKSLVRVQARNAVGYDQDVAVYVSQAILQRIPTDT